MKGYTVDLETSFAGRGSKRKDAWILQIGAAALHGSKTLNMMTKPVFRLPVRTPEDLYRELKIAKQQPKLTIGFWSNILHKTFKTPRPADMRSKAAYIIRYFPRMIPLHTALMTLLDFTDDIPTWYAHNGKSFDFPILRGNAERVDVDMGHVRCIDSLPLVRKAWPSDKSHSLPKVYANHVSKIPYNAHLAEDDAKALVRVLKQLMMNKEDPKTTHKKEPKTTKIPTSPVSVLRPGMIRGLGKVGCARLKDRGIRTEKQLRACVSKSDAWWKSVVPRWRQVRNHISYM